MHPAASRNTLRELGRRYRKFAVQILIEFLIATKLREATPVRRLRRGFVFAFQFSDGRRG